MFRLLAALSVTTALLATSSAAPVPRDRAVPPPRLPDSILLPGEWHVTKGVLNRNPKLAFGVGMRAELGGQKGRYRLNERAATREIDFCFDRTTFLGVYSLDGDELNVYYAIEARPTQLGPAPGVFVMRAVRKK